jgi:hypothetical protein
MHLDADEYLNVTYGDRSAPTLTNGHSQADVIGMQWRHFGKAESTDGRAAAFWIASRWPRPRPRSRKAAD